MTMNERYGDGSAHESCGKCGLCTTCGDCEKHGCGAKRKKESDFIAGVIYSAAQIIDSHRATDLAEQLLQTAVKPTDDLTGVAEYDLSILRANLTAWADVPSGV